MISQKRLLEILEKLNKVKITDKSLIWNTEIIEIMELNNLILQSIVSVDSAIKRTESRGAHSRIDFTDRNDKKWLKHNLAWIKTNGSTMFDFRPVQLETKDNEVESVAPKARVY